MEPLIAMFETEIQVVIDKYRDQGLTYGEAIGAMNIATHRLEHEALENDDE